MDRRSDRRRAMLPLTILGGSDLKPGELPPSAAGQHPLAAYKGVSVQVGGRPLVALLVERLRASGAFGPISIAGPRAVYEGLVPGVRTVDTDGGVAANLRAAVATFLDAHASGPLAVVSCDILPEREELAAALADFRAGPPAAVWFPLVRAPRDPDPIGAFGWKPRYPLAPARGEEPALVLPGHLFIGDPRALRMPLLLNLVDVAYATRNKPMAARRWRMVRAVLGGLLKQDLLHLATLRPPTLTASVLGAGLTVARRLRARELTREDVERLVARMLLRREHRRSRPEVGVRFPILDALSLAEDVDTEEEAQYLAERRAASEAPH